MFLLPHHLTQVRRLAPLVLATADYLASRVYFNESDGGAGGRYWLGPPVSESAAGRSHRALLHWQSPPPARLAVGGEESSDALRNYNPTFELVYTGYTLDVANEWRGWLGLAPDPRYEAVAGGLAALPLDPGSADAGAPRYTLNLLCACYYLEVRGGGRAGVAACGGTRAGVSHTLRPSLPPPTGAPQGSTRNPACNASWLPPGGTSCQALSSHPLCGGTAGHGPWAGAWRPLRRQRGRHERHRRVRPRALGELDGHVGLG